MAELWVIVMRNNILNHFALNDLKNHKKDTLITFIIITFIAIGCILLTSFTPIFGNSRIFEFQKQNGTFDYISYNSIKPDKLNQLQISIHGEMKPLKNANVRYSCVQHQGYTLMGDSIDYIEGDPSIIAIQLEEGRMPTTDNEIAVKRHVLENFGYQDKLDSVIEIPYRDELDIIHVEQLKVVGLIKETGNTSVVTGSPTSEYSYTVYIDTYRGDKIDNYKDINFELTFDSDHFMDNRELNTLIIMVQFVLFIVGCIILSGMTVASFDNRKDDYALLRGIGATKRQLYYIVFVQSILLITLSLIVAFLLSFFIIFIVQNIVEMIVPLKSALPYFKGVIFIVCLMTLISYFMPARGACYRALTGSFQGNEFQFFYYRYKKLHQMRPFYLAWRQLVGNKKQMIVKVFLIFISTLMLMNIIGRYLYTGYLESQKKEALSPSTSNEIYMVYTSSEDGFVDERDFDVFKNYASKIKYFRTFNLHDYTDQYANVYCYDENVKEEFFIFSEPESGEVIMNSQYNDYNELVINDEAYKVSNMTISGKNIMDSEFVVMTKEDFIKYGHMNRYQSVKITFDDIHKKTAAMIAYARQNMTIKYESHDSILISQQELSSLIETDYSEIPYFQLTLLSITGFIYMYQLSYEILKQRQTIGTYQLLGLRKFEIWKIYAYKSLFIALIGLMIAFYFHFVDKLMQYMGNGRYHVFFDFIPLLKQILPTLLMIIIFIILSLLPIYSMLKKDGLENVNAKD